MQSHRSVDMARSRTLRRLPALLAFSLLALLLMAPSAFAWHGYLRVVKNVEDANASRKAAASFTFKMDRKDTPSAAWTAEGSPYSLSNGGVWVTPAGGWATGGDTASIPWKQWKVTETGAGAGYSLSDYETSMVCDRPYKGDNTSLTGSLWSDLFYSWGAWPAPTYDAAGRAATTQLRWGNNYSYVTKCTFTNKRKPTIKIKKVFPNNPMGETQKVTFKLAGNAVTTSGGQSDFVNNSITNAIPLATNAPAPVIAEASTSIDLSKYTKTIDCTDASNANWSYKTTVDAANGSWTLPAALTPGQDVTCVVTNTRKAAKVKVIKYTDPVQANGFDLQVDGVTKAANVGNAGTTGWVWVDTGSHSARETATGAVYAATIAGWSSKYACAINPTNEPNAATGADGTASVNYNLNDGDQLVCVFRNSKDGKIRVAKQWEGPTNGETVDLTIDGTPAGSSTAPTDSAGAFRTVPGGSAHSYGETALDQATWQTTDLGCKNAAGQTVAKDNYGKVPVGAGDEITCTLKNRRRGAHIEVVKHLVPADDSGLFNLTLNGDVKADGVGNNGTTTRLEVPTGQYDVNETAGDLDTSLQNYDSTILCGPRPGGQDYLVPQGPKPGHSETVTLNDGDDVLCTITNTRKSTFKVVKEFVGPSGSDTVGISIGGLPQDVATPESSTNAGTPNFGDGDGTATQTVKAGTTVEFGENAANLGDYDTTVDCTDAAATGDAPQWSATVGAGKNVVCTITNTRKTGKLTLRKEIDPETDPGKFNLTAGSYTTNPLGNAEQQTFGGVPTGEYSLSEAAAAGTDGALYTNGSPVCVNAPETTVPVTDGKIAVGKGDDITCTWKNTRKSSFQVVKKFVGSTTDRVNIWYGEGEGATKQTLLDSDATDFGNNDRTDVTVLDGPTTMPFFETGVEGTDLANYNVKVACVDTKGTTDTEDDTLVGENQDGTTYYPQVGAGQTVVCTITNTRKTGKLTLKKLIVPSTDTGQFILNAGSNATEPLGNNGSQTFNVPTGSYALSEGGAEGTDVSDYILGEPSCVATVPDRPLDSRAATADVPVVGGKVTVGEGADITCTWTNTRKGKVIIKKIAPVTGTVFAFTGDLDALNVAANTDGVTTSVAPNASYKVTETVPADYTLTKIECVDTATGEGTASSTDLATATATANVQPGETVTCTFTNAQKTTPPGNNAAGVGASGGVSPVGASGGAVKKAGTAKISGTVGCAASTYASASVSGKQIRRVTFYVNGKKVKTLTKANAGTAYRLQYKTKSLKVGAYKVRAKVEFTTASGTKAKTLSLQFSRCTPRVVKPQFTG